MLESSKADDMIAYYQKSVDLAKNTLDQWIPEMENELKKKYLQDFLKEKFGVENPDVRTLVNKFTDDSQFQKGLKLEVAPFEKIVKQYDHSQEPVTDSTISFSKEVGVKGIPKSLTRRVKKILNEFRDADQRGQPIEKESDLFSKLQSDYQKVKKEFEDLEIEASDKDIYESVEGYLKKLEAIFNTK